MNIIVSPIIELLNTTAVVSLALGPDPVNRVSLLMKPEPLCLFVVFITALHGMQRWSSDEKAVRPSVRQTREL